MARTGLKRKSKVDTQVVELHKAYHEHALAVEEFAAAMRSANIDYIADHIGYTINQVPMTLNMQQAMNRFVMSCARLKALNGQKS